MKVLYCYYLEAWQSINLFCMVPMVTVVQHIMLHHINWPIIYIQYVCECACGCKQTLTFLIRSLTPKLHSSLEYNFSSVLQGVGYTPLSISNTNDPQRERERERNRVRMTDALLHHALTIHPNLKQLTLSFCLL